MLTPNRDCTLCPRLCDFHIANRRQYPSFHNAPVPSFGELSAELLVVGLAPGLKGANQTGRPFTGDYAGLVLYKSLQTHGLANGFYNPDSFMSSRAQSRDLQDPSIPPAMDAGSTQGDSLKLHNCRITNAVRCVPPENKPETSEIKNCNPFLKNEILAMPNLKVILSLGLVSHNAVLRALGHKASYAKFAHEAVHQVNGGLTLVDTYHCSRYNINTGRLSQEMFDAVVAKAKALL